MTVLVCDVETTGLSPDTDAIVEIAFVAMDNAGQIKSTFSSLVNPGRTIPPEACAIHHITDDMVRDAPSLTEALLQASVAMEPKKPTCYVAHNAAFDSDFLPALSPWICTWRLAQHLWPEAPAHGNSVLWYWLPGLNEELGIGQKYFDNEYLIAPMLHPMRLPSHRALPDAWVTAHIFKRMLAVKPLAELMELSAKPIVLRTVRFGQYRNKLWSEVPKDYLYWVASRDFDSDTIFTVKHYMGANQSCLSG